jgi:hypothetical protein
MPHPSQVYYEIPYFHQKLREAVEAVLDLNPALGRRAIDPNTLIEEGSYEGLPELVEMKR